MSLVIQHNSSEYDILLISNNSKIIELDKYRIFLINFYELYSDDLYITGIKDNKSALFCKLNIINNIKSTAIQIAKILNLYDIYR